MTPWQNVCRFEPPNHAWFEGGRLNATVSCIDRHVHSDRRNRAALIWIGEDGDERTYTYARLYREVNRLANALRRLGVKKGDRVVVSMPLVPEGVITMLACARLGAIHSVVYAGMGTQALKSRIEDSGPRVVVCSDFTFRRGKQVALKPTVDEAVRDLVTVEHVIVHRRGSRPGDAQHSFESEREKDFYDIQEGREIHCAPEPMDATDPLFILYTSGTTGKPKGVVHATGGYLVGVTYLARAFFQIGERDVYWSTSDIGWSVMAHIQTAWPIGPGTRSPRLTRSRRNTWSSPSRPERRASASTRGPVLGRCGAISSTTSAGSRFPISGTLTKPFARPFVRRSTQRASRTRPIERDQRWRAVAISPMHRTMRTTCHVSARDGCAAADPSPPARAT